MDELERGRKVLVAVTAAAVLMQVVRVGAHLYLLDRPFRIGLLGQVGLALWICIALWEGKEWARVVGGIYFVVAGLIGLVLAVGLLATTPTTPATRAVTVVQVVLATGIAAALTLSQSLQAYMASRRGSGGE